jgi:hypothetical protein
MPPLTGLNFLLGLVSYKDIAPLALDFNILPIMTHRP